MHHGSGVGAACRREATPSPAAARPPSAPPSPHTHTRTRPLAPTAAARGSARRPPEARQPPQPAAPPPSHRPPPPHTPPAAMFEVAGRGDAAGECRPVGGAQPEAADSSPRPTHPPAPRAPAPAQPRHPVPPPHLKPPRGGAPHLAARAANPARARARERPSGGEGRPRPPPLQARAAAGDLGWAPLGTRRGLGLRGPSPGRELQSRQELGAGPYLDPRAASGPLPPPGPDPAVRDLTLPATEPARRIPGAIPFFQLVGSGARGLARAFLGWPT